MTIPCLEFTRILFFLVKKGPVLNGMV